MYHSRIPILVPKTDTVEDIPSTLRYQTLLTTYSLQHSSACANWSADHCPDYLSTVFGFKLTRDKHWCLFVTYSYIESDRVSAWPRITQGPSLDCSLNVDEGHKWILAVGGKRQYDLTQCIDSSGSRDHMGSPATNSGKDIQVGRKSGPVDSDIEDSLSSTTVGEMSFRKPRCSGLI
jgi:hypothetical protein